MKKITFLLMLFLTSWTYSQQVSSYSFAQTTSTYTEITAGTLLGSTTDDGQRFVNPAVPLGGTTYTGVGLPIGFDFTFNGVVYDKFAVATDGWISLGSSTLTPSVNINTTSAYTPLSSTSTSVTDGLVARVAALGKDLQGQTGSTLRFETIGTAPNRTLVVQWKNYRKYNATGDSFNFQIRLNETTNVVDVVYGTFTSNNTTNALYHVGLRANPAATATNYTNRNSLTSWASTAPGFANTSAVLMSDLITPTSGLTFSWAPQTCLVSTALVVSNITVDSATIAWTAATSTPTGYEYYVAASDAYPTSVGTATTDLTAALSGLTQNTRYYVYIRTNCGTGYSAWGPMGSFKTLCTDTTFVIEDFDSYATAAILPDCWTRGGTATTLPYMTTGGVAPGSAPNRVYINSGATTYALLVLPSISNLAASTHRLKFRGYSATANKSIEVGYLTVPGDMTSFVILETIVLPGTTATTAAEFIVVPTTIPAGVKYIALRSNNQGATFYIDDVKWEPNPTCADITNLAGSMVTHNSIDLAWTAGGSETAWQYAIGASTLTNASSLTPVDVTASPTTINGLTAATSYKVWVRSKCSATDLGAWIGPVVFTTTCTPVTAFTQNFDVSTAFPACWAKVGTQGSAYPTSLTVAPSLPNALYLYSSSVATQAYVSMPPVSNSAAGTHRLKFKARGSVVGAIVEVGYLTDINNLNTFIPLTQFATTSTTVFDNFVATLGTDPTTPYLAFRHAGVPTATIYIDDVVWEAIPTCLDVNTVSVYNVLDTSVDLAWVQGGSETTWQYVLGASTVTDPNALTPVNVSGSPALTVSSLTANTSYKVWIRSYCSATDVGAWVGPYSFKTSCATVATFSQGFDLATTFPDCWSKVGTLGSLYPSASTTAPSLPNYVYIYSSSATNQAVLSMQPVSNAGAGTHRLKFKARGTSTVAPSVLEIGYLTNYLDASTFIPLQTVSVAYSATLYTQYSVVLGTDPTTPFIAMRHPGSPTYSVYFDDVVWEAIPTCLDVNTVSLYNVTSTSIDAAWVAGGSETAWDYALGASTVTDPTTLTPVAVSTSPALTISALTPNTSYKIWIRSSCSATDKGAWIGPFTFKTACTSVTSFAQNFDIDTNFPDCWSKVGTLGSAYPSTNTAAPSQPNYVYFYGSATAQAIIAMQPVSNLGAGTHRFKFKARGTNTTTPVVVEVGYLTNLLDPTTFVNIQSVSLPYSATVYDTYIVEPGVLAGVSDNLAMRHSGVPASSTYMDDFVWEPIPSAAPVCATGITATPDVACGNFATTIAWTPVVGADGYYLTVGTTPGGSNVLNLQNIGNVVSYAFIGNHNTTYYYKVTPFNIIGSATGCSEQSFITALNGCYCVSLPTSNDDLGITNVQLGTTNFPTTDITYFNHTATPVSFQQAVLANVQITFATGYTYNSNVWIDFNDNFTFESTELVYSGESLATNPTTLNASFTMPLTAALGTHRMRIGTADNVQVPPNPCYSGTYGVTLDFNVTITAPPACLPVTGVDVVAITSSTASVIWTAPSPAPTNGYEYYVSSSNTAPTSTTTPTGTVAAGITTVNLVTLTPATTYYVWVRSVCGTTDFSPWSSTVIFTTACISATAPYSQNFESATVPAMPLCTSNINAGTGNSWTTASVTGYGFSSKTLYYAYSGTSAANAWFFTQPITLTAGTSYDISYKYNNNSTTYVEKMKVAYGTSATAAAMTTVLSDHPSITGGAAVALQNLVAFTPTVSGDYYFGFNVYSIADQYNLYLDDILVQATLANTAFDASGFSYYPNPVKNVLNLSYTKAISNVAVYNLLGQQVLVKSLNENQSQIDMSPLTQGTYLVKVTSDNQVKTIKVIKE